VITGLAALVAVAVAGFLLHRLNPSSGRGRIMAWEVSGAMLRNQPLTGVGAGRFSAEWGRYQAELWRHPDYAEFDRQAVQRSQPNNELFQRLAERGLPGGALYVLLVGIRHSATSCGHCGRMRDIGAGLGMLALLVAILMHSFVDGVLRWVPTLVTAHLAFGLIPAPVLLEAGPRRKRVRQLARLSRLDGRQPSPSRRCESIPVPPLVEGKAWRRGGSPGFAGARAAAAASGVRIDQELGIGLLEAGRLEEAQKVLSRDSKRRTTLWSGWPWPRRSSGSAGWSPPRRTPVRPRPNTRTGWALECCSPESITPTARRRRHESRWRAASGVIPIFGVPPWIRW
jgi:hypothetical protein